jgi:hypothetical protein
LGITDDVTIETKDSFFLALAKNLGVVSYRLEEKKEKQMDGEIGNVKIWHQTIKTENGKEIISEREVKVRGKIISKDDKYAKIYPLVLSSLSSSVDNIAVKYTIGILDEIQDFSEKEWIILRKICDQFVLLGDFDQRIYNSDLNKKSILQIASQKSLKEVFRFGKYIAQWVQIFSKNNKDLEQQTKELGIKPISIDCKTKEEENQKIAEIIPARLRDGGRIGIIAPCKNRLGSIHRHLESKEIKHYYAPTTADFAKYNFTSNDPVLITSASAKGLEFATVIVTGFDKDNTTVIAKRRNNTLEEHIYVSLSRAINHLFVLYNDSTIPELKNLPQSKDANESDEEWF